MCFFCFILVGGVFFFDLVGLDGASFLLRCVFLFHFGGGDVVFDMVGLCFFVFFCWCLFVSVGLCFFCRCLLFRGCRFWRNPCLKNVPQVFFEANQICFCFLIFLFGAAILAKPKKKGFKQQELKVCKG